MALVALKNASIFQGKHLVLSGVDFEISAGEFVYLIGQTGSGKSSVLKTLYGDLPLTQGEGRVADHELNGLKDKSIPALRRDLGIVFQDFQLLSDRSVEGNLDFVLRATGWEKFFLLIRIQISIIFLLKDIVILKVYILTESIFLRLSMVL